VPSQPDEHIQLQLASNTPLTHGFPVQSGVLQSIPFHPAWHWHAQFASSVPCTQALPVQSFSEQFNPLYPAGQVHLQLSGSRTPPFWHTNGHVLTEQSIPE
jgi:hypothetical protein